MSKKKLRLDQLLVELGIAKDIESAIGPVLAGEVIVDGQIADKVGLLVEPSSVVELKPRDSREFVSRAGSKLAAALAHFEISVSGKIILDVGASTGGFTDCLLKSGAKAIYAVDCGTNQLDWRLRNDSRVKVHEKLNARELPRFKEKFQPAAQLAVVDVSFISVVKLISPIVEVISSEAEILVLVKPHFELPPEMIEPGGVVTDSRLHAASVQIVKEALDQHKFKVSEPFESPLRGAKGRNKEFFLLATR